SEGGPVDGVGRLLENLPELRTVMRADATTTRFKQLPVIVVVHQQGLLAVVGEEVAAVEVGGVPAGTVLCRAARGDIDRDLVHVPLLLGFVGTDEDRERLTRGAARTLEPQQEVWRQPLRFGAQPLRAVGRRSLLGRG